jgi:hypothetical protein
MSPRLRPSRLGSSLMVGGFAVTTGQSAWSAVPATNNLAIRRGAATTSCAIAIRTRSIGRDDVGVRIGSTVARPLRDVIDAR